MATLAEDPDGGLHVFVKGAPDRVLDRCATQTGPDGGPSRSTATSGTTRSR
ncbi:hypothetical protein NKG05_17925 [Oerskovia sp. M15]